jgi:hypothetical protein
VPPYKGSVPEYPAWVKYINSISEAAVLLVQYHSL